jgi:hypothetical protein
MDHYNVIANQPVVIDNVSICKFYLRLKLWYFVSKMTVHCDQNISILCAY